MDARTRECECRLVTLCRWRVDLAVRRRACRTRAARTLVRECAAWPLRGGRPSSVRHACGGPPVDDRGRRNVRNGERRGRAARDCRRRGIRAPPGAVSVRRRERESNAATPLDPAYPRVSRAKLARTAASVSPGVGVVAERAPGARSVTQ